MTTRTKPKRVQLVTLPDTPNTRRLGDAIAVVPVMGAVAIPRPALLRLALVLHDIKRSQEMRHAQAA